MSISIEGKSIGPGEKCFLIAEVSANHDGDLDQALELVDIAADVGWDCVKFQTYSADSLTVPSRHASMRIDPIWGTDNLYNLYTNAAMPMDFHAPLFQRVRERGMLPFTSIYDPRDLDFIEGLGCAFYKIASFEMTFDDLLIAVASTKKPVVMSTGMSDLAEVEHALEVLDRAGSGPIILLHCVSSYPTPPDEANLLAMMTLEARFGRPVGFSDHTVGAVVPLAAAALGAVAIEKHFTNDSARKGPDHRFSATPDVMRDIADGATMIHAARGTGEKVAAKAEVGNRNSFRRSAFAMRDIAVGEVLNPEDYRFVRPNAGVPVSDKAALEHRTIARAIRQYDPITYDDLVRR